MPENTNEQKPVCTLPQVDDIQLKLALLGHKYVHSIDELETIVLNWSAEKRLTATEVIAKAIVDGLWAHERSVQQTAKTRANADTVAALEAEKNRKVQRQAAFDKIIAAKPTLATDDSLREEYLNLQRQYDVIDHPTYLALMDAHRKLQDAIKNAVEIAKKQAISAHNKAA